MKTFFINVFSTVVGIFVAGFVAIAFFIGSILLMIIGSSHKESVADNSVLTINLTGQMADNQL